MTKTIPDPAQLSRIADRYIKIYEGVTGQRPMKMSLIMDLDSACQAIEMDLKLLEKFEDHDFAHDVSGIVAHMDRSEYPGKLDQTFLPRCAR